MLHAGLDLSRRKLDVCLLSAGGEIVEEIASPADADGLRGLMRRVGSHGLAVRGVIESMTGARFVHDRLEELGWDVLIADAAKVEGLAPLDAGLERQVQGDVRLGKAVQPTCVLRDVEGPTTRREVMKAHVTNA
jgi:hypothetical protein